MDKVVHRVVLRGLMNAAFFGLLTALEWPGTAVPWWCYVVVIAGAGFVIPVSGALIAGQLNAIEHKVGSAFSFIGSFVVTALVGVVFVSTGSMVLGTDSLEAIGDEAQQPFGDRLWPIWSAVLGVIYAAPSHFDRWLEHRRQIRSHPNRLS